ncbi:MAG: HAMP domain-containing histidine kinase [Alphaproteobacteria bacterium]|nr:HAMP domain-containing histidine kinase [Alphaproteobacteria bacterium]
MTPNSQHGTAVLCYALQMRIALPPIMRSLSARLLVLTMFFVMVGEVMIFAPSVGRFRIGYLEDRIAAGRLAVLALEATPDNVVSQPLANQLLEHVGARGVVLHKNSNLTLMIDSEMPPAVDATVDLRDAPFFTAIKDAFVTLLSSRNRVLRVLGVAPRDPNSVVEVLLNEEPMRREMWDFGIRILELSMFISLMTAALVYLSLQWLLVRPMRRITAAIMTFRADPENAGQVIAPSTRRDEIGVAQRELVDMQETVREALRQRAHLAALGTAVTKINHDLRGILSTARLISDGLADSAAPEVRRVAPTLLAAIDRAVGLCTRTLDFTRESPPALARSRFPLSELVDDVAQAIWVPQAAERGEGASRVKSEVPTHLLVEADRDQLYRVLFNLCRNAFEAGAQRVIIVATEADGQIWIDVADDGPGLPPKARDNLFQAFTGSARLGGTGLGLAIARELMRAHGGDIVLVESTATGTIFRLTLPALDAGSAEAPRPRGTAPNRRLARKAAAEGAKS